MEKNITTSHLSSSAEDEQNNSSSSLINIAIAEEILGVLFSQGRINREEIKCILEKFPGHSYLKLPVNYTSIFYPKKGN